MLAEVDTSGSATALKNVYKGRGIRQLRPVGAIDSGLHLHFRNVGITGAQRTAVVLLARPRKARTPLPCRYNDVKATEILRWSITNANPSQNEPRLEKRADYESWKPQGAPLFNVCHRWIVQPQRDRLEG